MPEPRGEERGAPIEQPTVYRTIFFAFGVWAVHFGISYGAALIFPERSIARWIAVGAMFVAIAVLMLRMRRIELMRDQLALGAAGLSLAAIVLGTFPAIVG